MQKAFRILQALGMLVTVAGTVALAVAVFFAAGQHPETAQTVARVALLAMVGGVICVLVSDPCD